MGNKYLCHCEQNTGKRAIFSFLAGHPGSLKFLTESIWL